MIDLGNGVKLITRAEWGARPPKNRQSFTPSFGTTTHWEGPHMGTFPHDACFTKVRGIQAFHMDDRGWSDIAYTAVNCPHGFIFEGRWVGIRTAANGTDQGNSTAYAVCYLGGETDPFTDAAKHSQRTVLDWLDRNGNAGPGRNCHRDWKQTACPGDEICSWVKAGQPDPGTSPPEEDLPLNDDDKTIIRNIIRQEMYGDGEANNKGQTPIIRNEVQAIWESMLTTSHSVTRENLRDIAQMGAEDAADKIADAVVAKLPPSSGGTSVTAAEVKKAIQEVFAEVRYTTAPADVTP